MTRRLYDNASIKLPINNPADIPDPIEYTLQNVKDGDVWIKFNPGIDSRDELNELFQYLWPNTSELADIISASYFTGDGNDDWKCKSRYSYLGTDHVREFSYFYSLYLETKNQK